MSWAETLRSPSGLKLGLLANFAGTGWGAIMQFACVPLYLKFLGVEGFGLIGFYLMLQTLFQVMDLGLSPTINRELARHSVQPTIAGKARELVRTLEIGYWLIGIALGASLVLAAPWIATHWIKSGELSATKISHAVMLMGALSIFQWPISFYQGALMGLDRQALFNSLKIAMVSLSNGGAVLVLWLVSPTITAFLIWQSAVSAVQAVTIAICLWQSLPASGQPARFQIAAVRGVWRFAAGVSGITLIGLIVSQADKLIVSRMLPLKVFGYYSLAWAVSNILLIISGAVFNVVFPNLSAHVATGNLPALRESYHRGAQLMAVAVLPVAILLALFSFEILSIWTRNVETAGFDALILSILVAGSALNALLYLPYALQLSFGWTRLALIAGLTSMVIVIPVMLGLTHRFGPAGTASAWLALNAVNMVVLPPIIHRRLLRGDVWRYFGDVGWPLLAAAVACLIGRLAFPYTESLTVKLAFLLVLWVAAVGSALLVAPYIRGWALTQLTSMKIRFSNTTIG